MTTFIHKTNNLTSSTPLSSEIQEGEICLNTANIDSVSNGVNNGRMYIKTSAGEIRRFVSLGLPASADPSLKTRYGGTNNTFNGSAANSDGGDSVMIFNHSSLGNHTINRTAANVLTWHSGNNRLNINRGSSGAAQATVHIGGDLIVDTIVDRTTSFDSNFYILGSYNPGTYNSVRKILSTSFMSLLPSTSIPVSKLSGLIPVSNGGTNNNFSTATDGSIVYYSGSILTHDSNFRYNGLTDTVIIGGNLEFNPPSDISNDAVPIGRDGSNKIVLMDYSYNQDLNNDDNVTFNKLTLNNAGFASDSLVINNIPTDAGADMLGINGDGEIVKIGNFTTDQNLEQTSNIVFNKLEINNTASSTDALVVNNMPAAASASTDVLVAIDTSNNVVKTTYTIDQDLKTTDEVEFEKVTIDGGSGAGNTLRLLNLQGSTGGSTLMWDSSTKNVFYDTSTRRLKENITEYNKGLDTVLSLNPKYFNMINDPNKTLRAGLIAEDLADLGLDEFVTRDEHDNPNGINYDKLVILLINAIKELKNRIDNISVN